jgi:hypothetical protein
MKFFKKKPKVIGTVVEKMNWFYVVEKSGEEYKLYAIKPQEAVSPDYNIGKFAKYVGKEVIVRGQINSGEIWDAHLVEIDGENEKIELGGLDGL